MKKFITLITLLMLAAGVANAGPEKRGMKVLDATTIVTDPVRQVTPKKVAPVRLQAPINNRMSAKAKAGIRKAPKKVGIADLFSKQWMMCSELYEYNSEDGFVEASPAAGANVVTISKIDDTTIGIEGFTSDATEVIKGTINTEVDEELKSQGVIAEISIPDRQTLYESSYYGPIILSNRSYKEEGDPIMAYLYEDCIMINSIWAEIIGGEGEYAGYMLSGIYNDSMILPVNGTMTWIKGEDAKEAPVVIQQDSWNIRNVTIYNFASMGKVVVATLKGDCTFAIKRQLVIDNGSYGQYYTYAIDDDYVIYGTITGTGTADALTFDSGWTIYNPSHNSWYGLMGAATIAYTDGTQFEYPVIADGAATPANPEILEVHNYNAHDGYGSVDIDIPAAGAFGNDLWEDKLYYQLYSDIDGNIQPITFTTDLYTKLKEDMSIIPYSFTDYYDFQTDINDDESKSVYLKYNFNKMYNRIGVKSIYKGGGETRDSEIVWADVEKIEVPDPVTLPDGAEVNNWYFSAYDSDNAFVHIKVGVAFVGNDIYVQGLCDYLPDAWVKGTIDAEAGTATFASDQFYGTYNNYYDFYFVGEIGEVSGEDVVFAYDAEKGLLTTSCWIVLAGDTKADDIYDYYYNIEISRERPESFPVEVPEGLKTETYLFSAKAQTANYDKETESYVLGEPKDYSYQIQVGFDGNIVYFSGINDDCAKYWMKGTLSADGKTITIPAAQYMGGYTFWGNVFDYFITAKDEEEKMVDLVLNYNAENATFTTAQTMVLNGNKLDWEPYQTFTEVMITKMQDIAATPADPSMEKCYFEQNVGYNKIYASVSAVDVDGNPMQTSKLFYTIWIEKDGNQVPYTFTKALYAEDFEEDVVEIPYNHDGYDIYKGAEIIYFEDELAEIASWKKVGIQSIYYGGGERRESNIVWMENPTYKSEEQEDWKTFDTQAFVLEWRTMDEQFFGEPQTDETGAYKVYVRSEEQAKAAGNMVDDGSGHIASHDTQFFISFGKENALKVGDIISVSFEIKADVATTIRTVADEEPIQYLDWHAIGDVNASTSWEVVTRQVIVTSTGNSIPKDTYTIAFNLADGNENNIYFKNIVVKKYVYNLKNIITNSDLSGEDMRCFYQKIYPATEVSQSTATDGAIVINSPAKVKADWDSQFFIVFPQTLPAGSLFKVSFECKASTPTTITPQAHNAPGQYIHWQCIDDVPFSAEWTTYESLTYVPEECDGSDNSLGYKNDFSSICFNLSKNKDITYYFKNIKVEIPVEKEVYTEFVEETGTLTYYYDKKREERTGVTELYDPINTPNAVRFNDYNHKIVKAVIDPSMKNAPLTSTNSMFYGGTNSETFSIKTLYKMTTIEGLENLNTANVTDMYSMFFSCSALTTLDLSSFNTSKVTSMNGMFLGCNKLEVVDVSSFDISNVTDMRLMFSGCSKLKTIYCYDDWSTSTAQSDNMFSVCNSLVGGKGTVFDSKVIDNTYARPDGGTEAPGYFTIPDRDVAYTVVYVDANDNELKPSRTGEGKFGTYATLLESDKESFFNEDESIKYIYVSDNSETEVIKAGGTVIKVVFREAEIYAWTATAFMGSQTGYTISGETFEGEQARVKYPRYQLLDGKLWEKGPTNKEYAVLVDIAENNQQISLTYTETDIDNVVFLAEVEDIEGMSVVDFNTAKLRCSQGSAGYSASGFTTIVGSLPLGKYSITAGFFSFRSSGGEFTLTSKGRTIWKVKTEAGNVTVLSNEVVMPHKSNSIQLGEERNTGNAISAVDYVYIQYIGEPTEEEIAGALDGETEYSVYTEYDESTQTLTYYYDNMYDNRSGVTEMYNPDNTNIARFVGYSDKVLKAVIDPSMKLAPLTSLRYMFYGGLNQNPYGFQYMTAMTTIEGLENLNTTNVTDMAEMFPQCKSLKTLDLSSFNTANVTNMNSMFMGCSNLEIVDVSSFDISNVTEMSYMFYLCPKLTTICCSNDWSTSSAHADNMFMECTSLVGGAGTLFDATVLDKTYARPDGGTSAPGYFTADTMTGINSLTPALSKGEGEIYDLSGRKMSNGRRKGIYIIRMKDGTTKKTMIK